MNIDSLRTLVKGEPPETLVEELKRGSPTLNDLSNRFVTVAKDVAILTVFEGLRTRTVKKVQQLKPLKKHCVLTNTCNQTAEGVCTRSGKEVMMVDAESAKLYWPLETSIGANGEDHSSIAKLKRNPQNRVVLAVKQTISGALDLTIHISGAKLLNNGEEPDSVSTYLVSVYGSTLIIFSFEDDNSSIPGLKH